MRSPSNKARDSTALPAWTRGAKIRLAIFALAVAFGTAGAALATSGSGTVGAPLAKGTITGKVNVNVGGIRLKLKRPTDATFVTQTWDPGGYSGWHAHPGPVILVVSAGELAIYDEHCRRRVLSAGQGFVEPVNEPMNVRNEGRVRAVAFFTVLTPRGDPPRVDAPNPRCNTIP